MPRKATSASFKKGEGGRKKGVPNKATREVKEVLRAAFDANIDRLNDELAKLEGKDLIDAVSKILPYFAAKAEVSIKHSSDDDSPFVILVKRARD